MIHNIEVSTIRFRVQPSKGVFELKKEKLEIKDYIRSPFTQKRATLPGRKYSKKITRKKDNIFL